jgi:hypothetical protein
LTIAVIYEKGKKGSRKIRIRMTGMTSKGGSNAKEGE